MSKKFLFIALIMAFALAMSGVAFAQDDDATDDDVADDDAADDDAVEEPVFHVEATAGGDYPVVLAADTEYEFAFDVFNDAGGDVAIKYVAITLPTTNYQIGDYDEEIEGSTDGFTWAANEFDEDSATISWAAFGPTSSVEMGDIQEGDMLTFTFFATTDTEGTDGFNWVLTGDEADDPTMVAGIWSFGGTGDDDDDDDDTTPDEGDDDDDDSGGCGC